MAEGQQEAKESKEAKFTRLATKRTQTALGKITLLGNLASSSYQYTDEQAAKIISSLRAATDAVESKFNKVRGGGAASTSFSL